MQRLLPAFIGLVSVAWFSTTADCAAAIMPASVQSILRHESSGSNKIVFEVPPGTRSVSLQGWATQSKRWIQLSSRRAPRSGTLSFRVPRVWQQRSLRVVASARSGDAIRTTVDHQVTEEGKAITFSASHPGARLYSIESQNGDSSGWQRVSTVAPPAEGSPLLRVALPSSLPAGTALRVVAVSGVDRGGSLLSPLSARLNSGPVLFGGISSLGNLSSTLAGISAGSPPDASGKVGGDLQSEVPSISQSDVWSVRGSRIYFFNQLVGLQIIDTADRQNPVVSGQFNLPAVGEQMYLLGGDGTVADAALLLVRAPARSDGPEFTRVLRVGVAGDLPAAQAQLDVPGYFVESRMAGNMLHLVTSAWQGDGGEWRPRTWLTSFDLSISGAIVQTEQNVFEFSAAQVGATDKYLWISGPDGDDWSKHRIRAFPFLLDGSLGAPRSAALGGVLLDKFKVGDVDGGLAAVVQSWRAPDGTWQQVTAVETLRDNDSPSLALLDRLELIRDESLFATRFDGSRLYAVTFRQVDPLWLVDLSDPSAPAIVSELEVPGWSSFIEPMGDVLVAVGREDSRVQISLFDVSDPAAPSLAQRVYLGSGYSWSEAEWDERAVRILRNEGLILLPVTEHDGSVSENKVALVDFDAAGRTLRARGSIAHDFSPRRATLLDGTAIASVSNRELLLVDATDRDNPLLTAEIRLAFGSEHVAVRNGFVYQLESGRHGVSGDAGRAVLRVAPAADPAAVTREIFLEGSGVSAAAVFGDRLCIVENNQPEFFALSRPEGGSESAGTKLSVWSLADPASPVLLGRATLRSLVRGTATLHEVSGGNVAVAQRSSNWFFRPFPVFNLAVSARSPAAGDARMSLPWGGWSRGSLGIDIVGVSDSAPSLLGSWEIQGDDISTISAVHSAGDLLAFSITRSGPDNSTLPASSLAIGGSSITIAGGWTPPVERCSLQILDFADPTSPMPWAPVEIPGELLGVAWLQRAGGVIFARSGEARDRVAALGFDGERAALVAEVEVGSGVVSTSGRSLFAAHQGGVREWTFEENRAAWQSGRGWEFPTGFGVSALQPMDGALLASSGGDVWALLQNGSIVAAQTAGFGNVELAAQTEEGFLVPAGEYGTLSLPLP